ncbi:MAG: hypothetical protein RL013_628, partial [Bacteroidota bacterium]
MTANSISRHPLHCSEGNTSHPQLLFTVYSYETVTRCILIICLTLYLSTGIALGSNHPDRPIEIGRPLFMENKGQITDQTGNLRSDVLYVLRTKGASVAITRRGLSYQFANTNTENPGIVGIKIKDEYSTPRTDFYRMDVVFSDANEYSRPVPAGEPEYVENYFNIPGSPEGITGVKGYERITLEDVWPGIDWVVYTDDGFIKYDFVVHPGADPSRIAMEYKGAVSLSLQSDGTLLAVTPMGEIREAAPVCFSGDEEVETRFVLEGEQLSFQVGEYDKT